MHYVNPFELLGISNDIISPAEVNKARKKLLTEIELSDTNSIVYHDHALTKSDCIRAIDDLDNKDEKDFHFFIYQKKSLLRFLTKGDLFLFENYQTESIYKLQEFLEFISPYFSRMYDKVLSQNFKANLEEKVKRIVAIKPITTDNYISKCYQSTYTFLRDIDNEISDIVRDTEDEKITFSTDKFSDRIETSLKKIHVPLINVLPNYFQGLRNQLASSIRNLARNFNNKPYENYRVAFRIIEIANNISTDGLAKQTITKGYYTIKGNYEGDVKNINPGTGTKVSNPVIIWAGKINQIDIITRGIENGTSKYIALNFVTLESSISEIVDLPTLNSLTDQEIKNRVADSLRLLSVIINNKPYNNYRIAFSIISIANKVYTAGTVKEKILNAYNVISKNYSDLISPKTAYTPNFTVNPSGTNPKTFTTTTYKNDSKDSRLGCVILIGIGIIIFIISNIGKCNNSSTSYNPTTYTPTPSTDPALAVDSTSVTVDTSMIVPSPDQNQILTEPTLTPVLMSNGNITGCPAIKAKYNNELDNYLLITVGSNADVAVKLIDFETERCIRYVYINKNSTYRIRNIPEGRYYVKIAYGENWAVENGKEKCEGKFTSNALYKKGEEILDYNISYGYDGRYQVPSFSLKLDVIYDTDNMNRFNSNTISPDDFYK